jgi:acyl carrier protein
MTDIKKIIYDVIDEINEQLTEEKRLEKSSNTIIVGEGGVLDSLGVINFLVSLEDRVATQTGQPVALLKDDLIDEQSGTLRTVESISEYIAGNV